MTTTSKTMPSIYTFNTEINPPLQHRFLEKAATKILLFVNYYHDRSATVEKLDAQWQYHSQWKPSDRLDHCWSSTIQLEKHLSSTRTHTQPCHFRYGVWRFWASWRSPLHQKVRHNKRKLVATSNFQQKSENWRIKIIQQLHQLWTHVHSPEGATD